MKWSGRSDIPNFLVMNVMREAASREAQGVDIVHMEVGQPATPAPKTAIQAAKAALDSEVIGYTLALGRPTLRQRIAEHYNDTYGLSVDPRRVIVTSGSSAGFVLTFLALFDVGDEVALPVPGYPCYRHILSALGQIPTCLETNAATGWMPEADQLAKRHAASPQAGMIIASPANPTGTMASAERFTQLAEVCQNQKIWMISDEIYHGLTYGQKAHSALSVNDDAIVINSFSKYFSMTGWRIGWVVVPERLVNIFERLAQNFYISPPTLSQIAAEAAFEGREELEETRRIYAANRELLLDALPELGITKLCPADGAFYIYADISHLGVASDILAGRILDDAQVAVTPGIDFDDQNGSKFIRFCYAGSTDRVSAALKRLKRCSFLQT